MSYRVDVDVDVGSGSGQDSLSLNKIAVDNELLETVRDCVDV